MISIIVIGPILLSCIKFCCCTKPPTKNAEDAADADESSQNYNEVNKLSALSSTDKTTHFLFLFFFNPQKEHEREPIGNNSRPCDTPYLVQPHSSLSPLVMVYTSPVHQTHTHIFWLQTISNNSVFVVNTYQNVFPHLFICCLSFLCRYTILLWTHPLHILRFFQ